MILTWLPAPETVNSVIIGVGHMSQLEDNPGPAGIKLTGEDLARLGEASVLPDEFPGLTVTAGRVRLD